MAFLNFFTLLIICYSLIFVLKCYNKLLFLNHFGIEVSLFQIKWFTQRFNRFFLKCGNWHRKFIVIWFSIGTVFSILLIIPSMLLLVRTLIGNLMWLFEDKSAESLTGETTEDTFVLQPVVPGLNMPLAKTGHYVLTLLICSVVHEMGHAITSVAEDVTVVGSGVFVFLFLPAAYVDISTIELNAVKKYQQLRIFTAGIWNNIVLALFAFVILFSMSWLCAPLYYKDQGITVIYVEPNSTILGPSGLKVGDVITSLNGCEVKDSRQWHHCLSLADQGPVQSFCIRPNVEPEVDPASDCCKNSSASTNSLCFVDNDRTTSHCLKVRASLETSSVCNATTSLCASPSLCLHPDLKSPSRLLQVKRREEKDFLFVGNAAEVYYYTQVTDYVLKYPDSWISFIFWPGLPSVVELLLYYIASLSAGLAVLNVVPCFMLDGQHVLRVLVEGLFRTYDKRSRSIILLSGTIVGTLLIVSNLVLGIARLAL